MGEDVSPQTFLVPRALAAQVQSSHEGGRCRPWEEETHKKGTLEEP